MKENKSFSKKITLLIIIILVIGIGIYIFKYNHLSSKGDDNITLFRGTVWSKSDVMTIKDYPLNDIVIVAIPSTQYLNLMNEVDNSKNLFPIISQKEVENSQIVITKSQLDGKYQLTASKGKYMLCLGNIGRSELFPIYINGCLEIPANTGKETNVDIYWGEGGVTEK